MKSGKILLKPLNTEYTKNGMLELMPLAEQSFGLAYNNNTPDALWCINGGGTWLKLITQFCTLSKACGIQHTPGNIIYNTSEVTQNLCTHSKITRQPIITYWPAPVIYAICTILYNNNDYIFNINSSGIINIYSNTRYILTSH